MRIVACLAMVVAFELRADTFTVTNSNPSGTGTLFRAIQNANSNAGPDTIVFAIAGAGPHTISLSNVVLPAITDAVTIDGYSQAGASANSFVSESQSNANLRIRLVGGTDASPVVLNVQAGPSTIRGLLIPAGTVAGTAIRVASADNSVVTISGNVLGDVAGTISSMPSGIGIHALSKVQIGGLTLSDRNVISRFGTGVLLQGGAASGSRVQNNLFGGRQGADPNGNIANDSDLRLRSTSSDPIDAVEVGGLGSGAGNVFIGSKSHAIVLEDGVGAGHELLGNRFNSAALFPSTGLPIDLGADGATPNDPNDADSGPNNLQNHPVVTHLRRFRDGSASGPLRLVLELFVPQSGSGSYRFEIFHNPEFPRVRAQHLLASTVATLSAANAQFTRQELAIALPSVGFDGLDFASITATRLDRAGGTSEMVTLPIVNGGVRKLVSTANLTGPGSLSDALIGSQSVDFNVPAGADEVVSIAFPSAPFDLGSQRIIDGYSQGNAHPNSAEQAGNARLRVVLKHTGPFHGPPWLELAELSTLRGFAIQSYNGNSAALAAFNANVEGCYFGIDENGAIGVDTINTLGHIRASAGSSAISGIFGTTTIGGSAPWQRNVLAGGNAAAVMLGNSPVSLTTPSKILVYNNYIGTDPSGTALLGGTALGGSSVSIPVLFGGVLPGQANVLMATPVSVLTPVQGPSNTLGYVSVRGNRFLSDSRGINLNVNGTAAIANDLDDLDEGPNHLQNYPEVSIAEVLGNTIRIAGLLDRPADSLARTYLIDVYRSANCQGSGRGLGRDLLGSFELVSANGAAENFEFSVPRGTAVAGNLITVTASERVTLIGSSESLDITSEFSPCRALTQGTVNPQIFFNGFE